LHFTTFSFINAKHKVPSQYKNLRYRWTGFIQSMEHNNQQILHTWHYNLASAHSKKVMYFSNQSGRLQNDMTSPIRLQH